MPRTKGAKNKPKTPEQELERVRKLFEQQGKPFPAAQPAEQPQPQPQPQTEPVTFVTDDQPAKQAEAFACGNCDADLPSPLMTCPHCGAALDWST